MKKKQQIKAKNKHYFCKPRLLCHVFLNYDINNSLFSKSSIYLKKSSVILELKFKNMSTDACSSSEWKVIQYAECIISPVRCIECLY